ncbi:PucR family transcriptional regulator [Thermosyntropha sp.]|uniref:PucR family transcriptional regulator n=1 Tax=Thermosyntropha sp. TaxID=2740820 RepID=UPI00260088F1|nr:PucR family transcriptional regulator [Thermosyntropha sp.]MBO8158806.1 PucR family transcriptional regulator ligand-binding domain-containing protein [Thermosyntropha sp.]
MSITVKDMLLMFTDFKIMAGSTGLNRKISTVSVMDAPDIHEWLKGGEFLITTAYILRDAPMKISELLININNVGAAALGIKLNRFIKKLPEEVIQKSDELGIPLIYIPDKYAFTDIINPVLSRIVNEQTRLLQLSENIHNSFTQMVIKGSNARQIINKLKEIINKEIAFIDFKFDKIWNTCPFVNCPNIYLDSSAIDKILEKYKTFSVKVEHQLYGYLVLNIEKSQELTPYENKAVEHAITVLILELQKRLLHKQIESRYRDQFILDLIFNNIKSNKEVLNRAQLYGWNFTRGVLVSIIDIDNFKAQYLEKTIMETNRPEDIQEKIFKTAQNIFHYYMPEAAWTSFTDNIVFLIETDKNNLETTKEKIKKICTKIQKEIKKSTGFSLTVGTGNFYPCITEAHKSYQDALKAVQIGRNIYGSNALIFYDELGSYKLLGYLHGTQIAEEFLNQYLQNLIDYDKNNNTELVKTLWYISKNDWNLKAAAKELLLHHNTIKYRFNKICNILHIEDLNWENKLNLSLALKLWNIKNR